MRKDSMKFIKPGSKAWRVMALYVFGIMLMGESLLIIFTELFPAWVLVLHLRGGTDVVISVAQLLTVTLGSVMIFAKRKHRSKKRNAYIEVKSKEK